MAYDSMTDDFNYLKTLFIDEAMKALLVNRGLDSSSSDDETQTYILVDEAGNQVSAVLVDEKTVFTATANDIREGMVAATDSGVTVGTKEIPSYHTTEGVELVPAGSDFTFSIPESDRYDYTKLQAILCPVTSTIEDAVAADKVSIDNHVYAVGSTESLATVTVNHSSKSIVLGITNNSDTPFVIRYFTYKEEV